MADYIAVWLAKALAEMLVGFAVFGVFCVALAIGLWMLDRPAKK